MSALQVVIDAFLTAAELVALLFVSPVSATEQPSLCAHSQAHRLTNVRASCI